LGEFTEDKTDNFVKLNKTRNPVCNAKLQYTLAVEDMHLWDVMDKATFDTIETMSGGNASNIEYWDTAAQGWTATKPGVDDIRTPGIVHEASTAFVGRKEDGGSLGSLYRPHGVNKVVWFLASNVCSIF
jgi:hypothetical protein